MQKKRSDFVVTEVKDVLVVKGDETKDKEGVEDNRE